MTDPAAARNLIAAIVRDPKCVQRLDAIYATAGGVNPLVSEESAITKATLPAQSLLRPQPNT